MILELHLKLRLHMLMKDPTVKAPNQYSPTKLEDRSPDAGLENATRDHVWQVKAVQKLLIWAIQI